MNGTLRQRLEKLFRRDFPGQSDQWYKDQTERFMPIVATVRKQTASDIFNLAHKYAQGDETMKGSEQLRGYHYFNAIHKIGEFEGR